MPSSALEARRVADMGYDTEEDTGNGSRHNAAWKNLPPEAINSQVDGRSNGARSTANSNGHPEGSALQQVCSQEYAAQDAKMLLPGHHGGAFSYGMHKLSSWMPLLLHPSSEAAMRHNACFRKQAPACLASAGTWSKHSFVSPASLTHICLAWSFMQAEAHDRVQPLSDRPSGERADPTRSSFEAQSWPTTSWSSRRTRRGSTHKAKKEPAGMILPFEPIRFTFENISYSVAASKVGT